jgi:uncharacterized protein YbjQ (UPF0145 family)
VHDGFAGLLAEGVLKVCPIVFGEIITSNRLATVLVDTLEDLVAGGVSQAREERNELSSEGSGGLILKDNLIQLAGAGNLQAQTINVLSNGMNQERWVAYTSLIAHQSLRDGVDLMEGLVNNSKICRNWLCSKEVGFRTGWKTASSAIPAEPVEMLSARTGDIDCRKL